ncbi:transporter substrate-binding domain-containing protein, partial [bacterium]|nr:transporter substrate-binding domain-containing protein [bacterium]
MTSRYAWFLMVAVAAVLCAAPMLAAEDRTQETPLIIGAEIGYPPYSFLDKNGEATGYDVELTRAIAQVMDLNIEIRIRPWGEIRQALELGEIDAVMGMFYSTERDELVDFSPPYAILHNAIFVRSGAPAIHTEDDLRGRDIIVVRKDIMHDYVLTNNLSDAPILVDTQADA